VRVRTLTTIQSIAYFSWCVLAAYVLPGFLEAQVKEVIPLPTTPGTKISNLNSAVGYVRAKASPDECWTALGLNARWDFINQTPGQPPCLSNQIPKVDQGYIWGQTVVGSQIFFGTFANAECVGASPYNSNPNPVVYNNAWACEFTDSPYTTAHGGPLPPAIGDDRPPRMYVYNVTTHTIQDITPKVPAAAAAQVCSLTGNDAICVDPLWSTMIGVRSATSYVEPTTGKTYVIVSGQALVNGPSQNAINFYIWGISENRWVAKYQYVGYSDIRHWLSYQGVLYAAAFRPTPGGGSLLRFTGSLATVPAPSSPATGSTVANCGTSPTNPPAPTGVCVSFTDVGDFDTPASEVTLAPAGVADAGRIFVGTWAPPGPNPNNLVAGIYMSPVVPAGGLTSANAGASGGWSKVWNAGNYDPDPVIQCTYGVGGMTFFNGYLYWGTLNPTLAAIQRIVNIYGKPTDPQTVATFVVQGNRSSVVFNGQNFSTATPTVNLLYGNAQLPVYVPANPNANPPTAAAFVQTKNNVPSGSCITACGTPATYGLSGFDNVFTNYTWTMTVINTRLYVGTMNWEFLAYTAEQANISELPTGALSPSPSAFGGKLYYFPDTFHGAIPVSTTGVGNFLNYGVRNIIPYSSTMFFVGTANPMSLATTPNTGVAGAACNVAACQGGWELIEIDPAGTVASR
jgi:hypothetical protein